MESGTTGIGRLDCYEDMFKEITRKLYGDDPDHRTSSVQNEFEASVTYKTEQDTDNNTDSDEWTCEEEPLKGTDGSRIAAYHAAKSTWRCYECGECMTGTPRDIAEHFMELHSSRILEDTRNRHPQHQHHHLHHQRKDYLQSDLKLEDILTYLEGVRERAERQQQQQQQQQQQTQPARRTQETQTVPATLLPATTTFLLQELPSATPSHHLHTNLPTMAPTAANANSSGKRYTCPFCPYGTDRRDLFTRHENIHRENKPFQCYVCMKPFNRADHVKKHFTRMHRDHDYQLSKIRKPPTSTSNAVKTENNASSSSSSSSGGSLNGTFTTNYSNNKNYQLQTGTDQAVAGPSTAAAAVTMSPALYQGASMTSAAGSLQEANCNRRVQNTTGGGSKSNGKGKGAQEKRYSCCYCSWTGVDNWCLKRHLNTHLKPYACALCEYKAARSERLATHVFKVHNKRQCSRCSFLSDDLPELHLHQQQVHRLHGGNNAHASVPVSSAQTSAILPIPNTGPAPPPPLNRHDPVHPASGRPPPGPPVFPAPATAVVPPPTTILGEHNSNGRTRSRKQKQPKKVRIVKQEIVEDEEKEELRQPIKEEPMDTTEDNSQLSVNHQTNENNYLRCYKYPKILQLRLLAQPYHTKMSLALEPFWRRNSNYKQIMKTLSLRR